MSAFADIEARLDASAVDSGEGEAADAARLLALAEDVLAQWITARGETPTQDSREGFRLLALHRQGAQDLPSFNACRETCREIAYHYNLIAVSRMENDGGAAVTRHAPMMALLVRHLLLFVSGKMQTERLGEFCCASRPLRVNEQQQPHHDWTP